MMMMIDDDLLNSAQFYMTERLNLHWHLNTVQQRNTRKMVKTFGIIQIAKANLVDHPSIKIQLQTEYIYISFL